MLDFVLGHAGGNCAFTHHHFAGFVFVPLIFQNKLKLQPFHSVLLNKKKDCISDRLMVSTIQNRGMRYMCE